MRSLSFSAIVVAGSICQLALNALDTGLDGGLLAIALDDGRVVLVDLDLLGPAQLIQLNAFELNAQVFKTNGLAAGQRGNVFQQALRRSP